LAGAASPTLKGMSSAAAAELEPKRQSEITMPTACATQMNACLSIAATCPVIPNVRRAGVPTMIADHKLLMRIISRWSSQAQAVPSTTQSADSGSSGSVSACEQRCIPTSPIGGTHAGQNGQRARQMPEACRQGSSTTTNGHQRGKSRRPSRATSRLMHRSEQRLQPVPMHPRPG
jgi:hypothetical protein